jgi:hypothetical protein
MLALLLACSPDPADSADADAIPSLDPPAAGEGVQMAITGTAPPNAETWLCVVYDLETTELTSVNRVEYLQTAGTHHMTISTTAMGERIEPGTYNCADLYADSSMMENAIMMFGSQGDESGDLRLPEGVVAQVPAGIQIVHEIHYLNTGPDEVPLYSYVNAYSIPESEVTGTIWGGQVRDETIEIPAGGDHSEWTRCVMNEEVDVLFLASHTHSLGRQFTIAPFDGTTTGEVFYSNADWHDPLLTQYTEPIHLTAGQGFEYTCTWRNESDEAVSYGYTAADEMCNMTLIFTPGSMTARCDVVQTSDGVLWAP